MNTAIEDNRADWNGSRYGSEESGMKTREKTHEELTLVLGGTGKTGSRVAERLWGRGLPVRIGSRSGEPPFD